MLVYRFRLTSEEHENFFREIEILPGQTFLDFHSVILESSELFNCQRTSFFLTDKIYNKRQEITLKSEKRQIRQYDDDLDQIVTVPLILPVMKSSKLKNFIEDPHQKMIYEFHGKELFAFHIELFKIVQSDAMFSYPRCSKRSGELPRKIEIPVPSVEEPVATKVVIPKIPLPKSEALAKLDHVQEDEAELAIIESRLSELQEEVEVPIFEAQEVYETGETDETRFDGEDQMESLGDYDDIDKLERKYSGFDHDTDDY